MADQNAIFQNALYIGNNFNSILYGVELVLYFNTVQLFLKERKKHNGSIRKQSKTVFVLSTYYLGAITVYVATQAFFGEAMWIINEGYPGGSAAYFATNAAVWYETWGTASGVLMNLVTDGYQIHRTYVVYGLNWKVIVAPTVVYIAGAGLGITTAVITGLPSSNFFVGFPSRIALAYSTCSIAVNVFCSALICARILTSSSRINMLLGKDAAQAYTGAVSIIVESMLPFACFGIAYLITLGINSPLSIFFLCIYSMLMCLSPQMMMLRVLKGRALTPATLGASTGIEFQQDSHLSEIEAGNSAYSSEGTDQTRVQFGDPSKSSIGQSKEQL